MAWTSPERDEQVQAKPASDEGHESHEPPRGALLITCGYLVLIVSLWLQVYLQLLNNGGIPRP